MDTPEPDHVELCIDGDGIVKALFADLRAATREINVSMFLFFHDPIADELAAILCDQARAGVTVRVLLNIEKTAMGDPFSTGEREMFRDDPAMTHDPTDVKPLCKMLEAAGALVKDTNIDYDADLTDNARLRSVAAQIRGAIDVDDLHVDHRKIIVIDGRVAYCGGANVGAQYLYHLPLEEEDEADVRRREEAAHVAWWRRVARSKAVPGRWHDSLTRFEGPISRTLNEHFRARWMLDGGAPFECERGATPSARPRGFRVLGATVFTSEPGPEPNPIRDLYVRLIGSAQTSIFIENPYLYHPAIVEALIATKTARPEVKVTLILPAREWNDNSFGQDAQQYYYDRYLEAGIEVHEYQAHFNHLKIAVFDERWSIHGSTNLNFRSLEDDKDFELVVLVDDPALASDILERVMAPDILASKQIKRADLEGSLAGFRLRHRDPRTLLLLNRRLL